MTSRLLKNYCATLIRACAVLAILMYSVCTLRLLRSGRTRLKAARYVFQQPARFLALLMLLAPCAVQAIPPLPLEVAQQLPDLKPVGEGRLRWFGLHIYDAALWTKTLPVEFDAEFALDIRYARNIAAPRLVETSLSEMRRLGFDDAKLLEQWAVEMARVFPNIRKGDRLTGVNMSGNGAAFYHNGRFTGAVPDAQFARAFFSIWLDPRTREPKLRASLIGRE